VWYTFYFLLFTYLFAVYFCSLGLAVEADVAIPAPKEVCEVFLQAWLRSEIGEGGERGRPLKQVQHGLREEGKDSGLGFFVVGGGARELYEV
jgi:hypothetical protein